MLLFRCIPLYAKKEIFVKVFIFSFCTLFSLVCSFVFTGIIYAMPQTKLLNWYITISIGMFTVAVLEKYMVFPTGVKRLNTCKTRTICLMPVKNLKTIHCKRSRVCVHKTQKRKKKYNLFL